LGSREGPLLSRVILFHFPHDFLGLGNRVRDDDLPRRKLTRRKSSKRYNLDLVDD
jgi:hypothetical protein